MNLKTVMITGVSSGTGLGLTDKFIANGYRVVGSIRSHETAEQLQSRFGKQFIPLVFDISRPDQVKSAAMALSEEHDVEYLSAIINNAGSAQLGPLLHVAPDELRSQLDVLVVGQLTVIQSFYGFLMPGETTHAAGRIFNISSVSGVKPNVMFGSYAAGKHALEGLSKTLRKECEVDGVKVIVVAPGNIATAIWDKQTEATVEPYRDTDYYDLLQLKLEQINSTVVSDAMSVEEFCDAFFDVFEETEPADRYTIEKVRNKKMPFSKTKVRVLRA